MRQEQDLLMAPVEKETVSTDSTPITMRPKRNILPYILLLPGIILLLMILYPFLRGIGWSLTDYRLDRPSTIFVGLKNYIDLFAPGGRGFHALSITLLYAGSALAAELLIGSAVALLLAGTAPLRKVFRALMILPLLTPPVVATLMWKVMMGPNDVLNYLLSAIGLPAFDWFGSTWTALFSVVLIDVWIFTPFVILILLAGLNSVPGEVREAALVDGAGYWRELRYVTLPLLKPALMVVVLFRGIYALKMFDIIYVATRGGPIDATTTLHIEAYFSAIRAFNFGSAMAALFVLWLLCYGGSFLLLRRRREQVS